MSKRKVCAVITARPSYSRVKTALQAIKEHPLLELQIVLTGAALLNKYGNIEDVLHDDGFTADEKIYTVLDDESLTSMAKTVGIGLVELSTVFNRLQPHMVLVIADRFETISVSIAASYQNIPLVHIQGGEITGSIDEKVRHANTKLADIHLVCNDRAKQVVEMMGEDPGFVFNTGCPSVDIAAEVLKKPKLNFNPFKKYGGSGNKPNLSNGYIVVMQHPVTTEFGETKIQIEETLQAIKDLNIPALWFAPNADAGTDAISKSIRDYREQYSMPHVHFFNNMIPEDFLRLVYNSKCLVGNSSLGIRECAYLGVPVVNIGTRQQGRERGENVTDVISDKREIMRAVMECLNSERPSRSFVYGNGDAGKKIAQILATVPLRHEKVLNFNNEKPVHNTGKVRVERGSGKEYQVA